MYRLAMEISLHRCSKCWERRDQTKLEGTFSLFEAKWTTAHHYICKKTISMFHILLSDALMLLWAVKDFKQQSKGKSIFHTLELQSCKVNGVMQGKLKIGVNIIQPYIRLLLPS